MMRADVGISLYGDDLQTLTQKAEEIAAVLETIDGAADVGTEQVLHESRHIIRQVSGKQRDG